MVRYLIDFYVSKNFKKIEPVGFLSGRANTTSYGLYGVSNRDVFPVIDKLRNSEARIPVRFEKNDNDSRDLDVIFDLTEEQLSEVFA